MSYLRPVSNTEADHVIKKSQFIGYLSVVENVAQANDFIQQIKTLHPKASHNCHCYIAGTPTQSSLWSYSDDGEPKGCAGLPMFQVLKHSGLGNTCVVVTRYFGGVKLGTGGMARAYSATVGLVLEGIKTQIIHPTIQLTLLAPFELTGSIEHIISSIEGADISARDWLNLGQKFSITLQEPSIASFNQAISSIEHLVSIERPKN